MVLLRCKIAIFSLFEAHLSWNSSAIAVRIDKKEWEKSFLQPK